MSYWKTKKGSRVKTHSKTGRKRVIGHRNRPDSQVRPALRKRRVKGVVNTADKKSGRIVKRHRRRY